MSTVQKILGDDLAARVKPMWGLDEEGELRNVWRDTGVPNFWFMMGNLMWCRFHSKHLALRECTVSSSFVFVVCCFCRWHLFASAPRGFRHRQGDACKGG